MIQHIIFRQFVSLLSFLSIFALSETLFAVNSEILGVCSAPFQSSTSSSPSASLSVSEDTSDFVFSLSAMRYYDFKLYSNIIALWQSGVIDEARRNRMLKNPYQRSDLKKIQELDKLYADTEQLKLSPTEWMDHFSEINRVLNPDQHRNNFRDSGVAGDISLIPIGKSELQVMRNNPYLDISQLIVNEDGIIDGDIVYVTYWNLDDDLLDKIKKADPSLYTGIKSTPWEDLNSYHRSRRIQKIVMALTYYEVSQTLASIGRARSDRVKIDLIADLYPKLTSIHPFDDGNGRTTREIVNTLLKSVGQLPMTLLEPNRDYFFSKADWRRHVVQALRQTELIYEDSERLAKKGRDPLESVYFLAHVSYIPDKIFDDLTSKKVTELMKNSRLLNCYKKGLFNYIKNNSSSRVNASRLSDIELFSKSEFQRCLYLVRSDHD